MMTHRYKAVLLLGPTGSGKTPLGAVCEQRGLWNTPCRHFDFGDQLRRIGIDASTVVALSEKDRAIIRRALATGALLEKEHFHIAQKILQAFVRETGLARSDLILLNGLPRHRDQADDVGRLVDIVSVIRLECLPHTVRERIRSNAGGDRAQRTDDSEAEIAMKLALFQDRTLQLLDYYRRKDIPVLSFTIRNDTRADVIHRRLERHPPRRQIALGGRGRRIHRPESEPA